MNVAQLDVRAQLKACALAYARIGWHVLPLEPRGKRPLARFAPNGFHNATTDLEVITRWWTEQPDANIGIALKASGLVAVDVDARNGGYETLAQLESQYGSIASDVMAFTGGGGQHFLYLSQLVHSLPGTLGPGIDLKADGYIAVEPSIHPDSGKAYEWEASSSPLDGCIPSTLPGWIRDQQRGQSAASALPMPQGEKMDDWASKILKGDNLHDSTRDFAASCVASGMHPGAVVNLMRSLMHHSTAPRDARWAQRMREIHAIVHSAVKKFAQDQDGYATVTYAKAQLETLAQLAQNSHAVRWQVKHLIAHGDVGMIFGASGTFKSFIGLDLALHIAHGLPWLNQKTTPGKVVYVAAEGGGGLYARIRAWHQARALALTDNFLVCRRAVQFLDTEQVARLREEIQRLYPGVALIIIDTLSQTFSGNENSNNEVAAYLTAVREQLAAPIGATALIVHHSGHGATERPRGASSIRGNLDCLFGVFRTQDGAMAATLECQKQKESAKEGAEFQFLLDCEELGVDEDGEAVTSLTARHAGFAGELLQEHDRRTGGEFTNFLRLARELGERGAIRKAFYEFLGDIKPDSKQKAFKRAINKFEKDGLGTLNEDGSVSWNDA